MKEEGGDEDRGMEGKGRMRNYKGTSVSGILLRGMRTIGRAE